MTSSQQSATRNGRMLRALSLALLAVLCGCGAGDFGGGSGVQALAAAGKVQGGQQGVSGAQIQLYAVSTMDGGAATALLTAPVVSGADGSFSLGGVACPSAVTPVYLVASGGNPGLAGGMRNAQSVLVSAVGACGSLSTGLNMVDEATTVAAVSALAPYMSSATAVGGDAQGIAEAFTLAHALVDPATGRAPGIGVPAGQTVPVSKLQALADILAACVDSTGGAAGDGSACGQLFALASAAGDAVPADTAQAMLSIGRHPAQNVVGIYQLLVPNGPYQPVLSAPPADWSLGLSSAVSAPVFSPGPGTFNGPLQVTVADASAGAAVFYTTDGTLPNPSSTLYSGAIAISSTTTLRAIAVAAGLASLPVTGMYAVQPANPLHLAFVTQPAGGVAGLPITPAPAVAVEDASGAVVTGAHLAVTLSLSGGAASGGLTVNTVGGLAAFPGVTVNAAGSGYVLNASAPGAAAAVSAAFAVSSPAAAILTAAVPATYFGMTVQYFMTTQPAVQYGTTRSWDAYYYSYNNTPGVDWPHISTSRGSYNFTALDSFISVNQARNQDIIYTFGLTPQWASADPSNTSSGYGPGECAPPASLADWDAFVTAIVTHAKGKIKYWELWNEPQDSYGYCGDIPTMVALSQHAYAIIKAIDPTATVLSPAVTSNDGPAWLEGYLKAGGGAYFDVLAFHGYWSTTAEDITTVVGTYNALAATYGLTAKPVWDTEASWAGRNGGVGGLTDLTQRAAFLSKYYLLHWSLGVSRFVWYAYDATSQWGQLWDSTNGLHQDGVAYGQTYAWMVGATLTAPCSEDGQGTWSCHLTRPNGYQALALWNSGTMVSYSVTGKYKESRDLQGKVTPISGGSVQVSNLPILLETGPLP